MFPARLRDNACLELLELRHADELYAVTDKNRQHLREWLPWLDNTRSAEDTKAFIRLTRKQLADDNGFQTVIRYRGALVGVIGHHRVDRANRATSLGYWLAPDAQRQGIMTDACRMYIEHAFQTMGLHRVEIRCAVENRRSRALPERLGFRAEGTIRHGEWLYDRYVDHVLYGLLAEEWSR
jgi:ribosomal-protein-serine acetyltransferase